MAVVGLQSLDVHLHQSSEMLPKLGICATAFEYTCTYDVFREVPATILQIARPFFWHLTARTLLDVRLGGVHQFFEADF